MRTLPLIGLQEWACSSRRGGGRVEAGWGPLGRPSEGRELRNECDLLGIPFPIVIAANKYSAHERSDPGDTYPSTR